MAAKKRLNALNSEVIVKSLVSDVSVDELEQLVYGVDLIVDATDNFDTRMLINDSAQKFNIPWIYGACVGSYGISYTVIPQVTPCLNCLLETVPIGGLTCDTAGIISPAVQTVVAHQLTEALKILVEDYGSLRNKIVSFDLWKNEHSSIHVAKLKKTVVPHAGRTERIPTFLMQTEQKQRSYAGGTLSRFGHQRNRNGISRSSKTIYTLKTAML